MRKKLQPGGFSLIEVMIAAAILAVGATAILSSYATIMALVEHQRRVADAINVTQAKMEELLAVEGSSDLLFEGRVHADWTNAFLRPLDPYVADAQRYDRHWEIDRIGVPPGIVQVVVSTTWNEHYLGTRSLTLRAYRSK